MTQNLNIEVRDLRKNYRDFPALKGITFQVQPGERVAILGSNGAGKSTLIDILSGVKFASSGDVVVLGHSPGALAVRKKLSVMPQFLDFPKELRVKEVLDLVSAHHGVTQRDDFVEKLDLGSLLNRPIEKLSGGQKRRVSFLMAFVGGPEIVILDEPTASLDMESKALVYGFMEAYFAPSTQRTLLFSSHSAQEIERLADRIVLLHQGNLVFDGPLRDIYATLQQKQVSFFCDQKEHSFFQSFSQLPYPIHNLVWKEGRVSLLTQEADQFVSALVKNGVPFSQLEVERSSLEDIILGQWKASS